MMCTPAKVFTLASVLLGAPVPAAFSDASPAPEALRLAAEQLWIDKGKRVSAKITELFAHAAPSPVHAHAGAGTTVAMPSGSAGMRLRASRKWQMVRRNFTQLLDGRLRPRNIARDVEHLRKRERLFALVESAASSAERPPR